MQLVRLPRRQPQRPVAHVVRQVVHRQVQPVRHPAGRLASPHHKLVRLPLPGPALLAVVLLVAAVELHQLGCVLGDVGRRRGELLHERVAEVVRLLLEDLDLGAVCFCFWFWFFCKGGGWGGFFGDSFD